MLVEAVQMMSTGLVAAGETAPWKPAFPKHPMTIWVGAPADNFAWTHALARALAQEYEHRFDRGHGAAAHLGTIAQKDWTALGRNGLTPAPLCMPEEYKIPGDVIGSYRAFYAGEKSRFARYTRRPIPDFMMNAFLPMSEEEIAAARTLRAAAGP